jgi:hypothetical protein
LCRLAGIFWRDFVSETPGDQELKCLASAFWRSMKAFLAQRLSAESEDDDYQKSLKGKKSGRRKSKNVRSVMSLKAIFKD